MISLVLNLTGALFVTSVMTRFTTYEQIAFKRANYVYKHDKLRNNITSIAI